MRFASTATILFIAVAFAGCTDGNKNAATSSVPTAAVPTNFITPDTWRVSAETDRILVWVHNEGATDVTGKWNLTLAGNQPLPAGWTVTFQTPSFTLKPAGTKA